MSKSVVGKIVPFMKSFEFFYKTDCKLKFCRIRFLSHFYRLCRQADSQS